MAQSQSPRLPVKRGVGVYLFVKECFFTVRVKVRVRVGLVSTLTLTLKQNSLTKR